MHVEGMVNIRVCANNIQATLRVAVSSELKENMLISCDNLRKLRVIPADFPNAVLSVGQSNKLSHLKVKLLLRTIRLNTQRRPKPGAYEMPSNVNCITGQCHLRYHSEVRAQTL